MVPQHAQRGGWVADTDVTQALLLEQVEQLCSINLREVEAPTCALAAGETVPALRCGGGKGGGVAEQPAPAGWSSLRQISPTPATIPARATGSHTERINSPVTTS